MKLLIVLALIAYVSAYPAETYDFPADFDLDEVLRNQRLMENYMACVLGAGKCTPEGKKIQEYTPDAIKSSCSKCTEKQKAMVAKFMTVSKAKLPEQFNKLNLKYNPDGKYDADMEEFMKTYGN